ncbi:Hypothetical predicted protein [Paramuricea clavata]|uniref:Uncharacterized protein n=1 Tax=Paramuricea clavata TaxID=317549 RepID=A0A6S7HRF9_PARCT|nr:Hypothetical predicted protein [Paramuricea clavata]
MADCRIPQQVSVAKGNEDSPRLDSTSQKQAAEMFNDYFHTVFLTEGDDISIPATSVCEETISDIILDPSEAYDVLHCLEPSKASGPDNIPIRLLKQCAHSITPSLACLLSKFLKQASLPSEWKLSNIIPLHNKGIKNFVENYRPISLMCVIALF